MIEVYLSCPKNAKLIFGENIVDLTQSKKLVFDEPTPFCLQYFFESDFSKIYSVQVGFDGTKLFSKNKNATLVDMQKNIYVLRLSNHAQTIQKIKKIVSNGKIFSIFANGNVVAESENQLLLAENFDVLTVDASVTELANGFFAVNLALEDGHSKTVIYNSNNVSILTFDNAILEATEQGFKVLIEPFDIASHGIVETYSLDETDAQKTDEYSVFLKNRPLPCPCQEVLPAYFLECVKANDFGEAKKCLNQQTSQKVKNEALKSYFGNFVDIVFFDGKIFLTYDLQKKYNQVARQCNFLMQNGKISKIELT